MFDPYHRWLAIPPDQRPPTLYQLLGIAATEADPEVIKEAALRQASHVRTYQVGPHAQECTTMLNEIGHACATLINPSKRREYDSRLTPPRPDLLNPDPANVPAQKETEPLRLAVTPAIAAGMEDVFGLTAAQAEASQILSPHHRQRPTRTHFWLEPMAYLYICLLCAGGGLGSWVAGLALAPVPVRPDKPVMSPQPRRPPGEPGKTVPARNRGSARTPQE